MWKLISLPSTYTTAIEDLRISRRLASDLKLTKKINKSRFVENRVSQENQAFLQQRCRCLIPSYLFTIVSKDGPEKAYYKEQMFLQRVTVTSMYE